MILNVLASGSSGNCYVVTDDKEKHVIIDCGVSYEQLVTSKSIKNWFNLDFVLYTHKHSDHYSGMKVLKKKLRPDILGTDELDAGKRYKIKNWEFMPIEVRHNIKCYGYIIENKIENKKILILTDTSYMPNLDENLVFDFILLETNYSEEYLESLGEESLLSEGHSNHNSLEQAKEFLAKFKNKQKKVVAIHISNSGKIDVSKIKPALQKYCEEVYIANKPLEIKF